MIKVDQVPENHLRMAIFGVEEKPIFGDPKEVGYEELKARKDQFSSDADRVGLEILIGPDSYYYIDSREVFVAQGLAYKNKLVFSEKPETPNIEPPKDDEPSSRSESERRPVWHYALGAGAAIGFLYLMLSNHPRQ